MAEAEVERNRILGDLRSQVASLAIAAANKLVGEALDEKKQRALLDEFFSGVKSGKVIVLDGASFKGESAEVTSALPLSQDEEATVRQDVLSKSWREGSYLPCRPVHSGRTRHQGRRQGPG